MSPYPSAIFSIVILILSVTMPYVSGQYALQVYVLTKHVNKLNMMTLKNGGSAVCVSSFLIKVKEGSILFVKAKKWERKRIDDKTVMITSKKGLEPYGQLLALLIWKGKAEAPLFKVTGSALSICS